jgi:hypothetical protein
MSFALAGMALLHIAEGDLESASRCAWEAWMQNTLVSTLGVLVCWSKYLQGDFGQALELVSQVRGKRRMRRHDWRNRSACLDSSRVGQIVHRPH